MYISIIYAKLYQNNLYQHNSKIIYTKIIYSKITYSKIIYSKIIYTWFIISVGGRGGRPRLCFGRTRHVWARLWISNITPAIQKCLWCRNDSANGKPNVKLFLHDTGKRLRFGSGGGSGRGRCGEGGGWGVERYIFSDNEKK